MLLRCSGSSAIKFISQDSEPCIARPTLIDLNPDEHNQGLRPWPLCLVYVYVLNKTENRRCKFKFI